MSFVVGDRVFWTSQAGGSQKIKTGVVVEVVPPSTTTRIYITGCGAVRGEVSYVVRVESKGRGAAKYYWPRVSQLRLAPVSDSPDLLEELIEEGERRSPGFREQVDAAIERRRAARGAV